MPCWGWFLLGLAVWPTVAVIICCVLYRIGKRELDRHRQAQQLTVIGSSRPVEIDVDELLEDLETLGKN
jgi:hypothetical protein